MANLHNMRLCGGTFLVLLLDAKGKRQTTRGNGRKGDGRNNPDIFASLLKLTITDFIRPTEGRTFNTFTSNYKNCRASDTPSVCLTDKETINLFDRKVREEYQATVIAFDEFIKYAVDVSTYGKRLVAALLDLINSDEIPDSQEFYIRSNGTSVRKDAIFNEEQYCLSSFLLGVWHYIVCNVTDNQAKICKDTIEYLLGPQGESRTGREVNCEIGLSRMEVITVEFNLPYAKILHDTDKTQQNQRAMPSANDVAVDIKPSRIKVSYKSNKITMEIEQSFLSWNSAVIDLNQDPNAYLLSSNRNAKFVVRTICQMSFEMAPDFTLQIKVRFTIDDTEFTGFTSSDNWDSQSYVNNLVSVGNYACIAWFKVINPNDANPQVQFFMIGEPDE